MFFRGSKMSKISTSRVFPFDCAQGFGKNTAGFLAKVARGGAPGCEDGGQVGDLSTAAVLRIREALPPLKMTNVVGLRTYCFSLWLESCIHIGFEKSAAASQG
jgi:hypothetical protein